MNRYTLAIDNILMESKEERARRKLNKIKSRVAKDNFIRRMIKEGIYL
jgi:hypothetical protein